MTASLIYPVQGRGAWPTNGAGGTLKADGTGPGRYFRSAATPAVLTVGTKGWQADKNSAEIGIDEYAVWRAALAVQTELRDRGFSGGTTKVLVLDGIWGKETDIAVKAFQQQAKLTADGVYGPASSQAMWEPVVRREAVKVDSGHAADLERIMVGTIILESGWDLAAVGRRTPQDLGLGQINGPSWPTLSVNDRLNPKISLPWIARFIDANLVWARYDVNLAVASYNLGRAGASRWANAGFPDIWPVGSTNNIASYIDKVLNPA